MVCAARRVVTNTDFTSQLCLEKGCDRIAESAQPIAGLQRTSASPAYVLCLRLWLHVIGVEQLQVRALDDEHRNPNSICLSRGSPTVKCLEHQAKWPASSCWAMMLCYA